MSERIGIVRPRGWDFAALAGVGVAAVLAALNLRAAVAAPPGSSVSDALTAAFVGAQFTVSIGSLLLLGKTAKEGTVWGNLFAVAGLFAGIGGVLLAAALWTAG